MHSLKAFQPGAGPEWSHTWDSAAQEFLLHVRATRARETHAYYATQVRALVRWAEAEKVSLSDFGKRHLDRYLAYRQDAGLSALTVHHSGRAAKVFLKWCSRNDILPRDPLAEYAQKAPPQPFRYMPSDAEMEALLGRYADFWSPSANPKMRFMASAKRSFHRDRNYAVFLGLLDSACRINELLSLKAGDYRADERQIAVRVTKGREPRLIPVSREWVEALSVWLKVRERVMRNVPKEEDEGWLFVSETGGRMDSERFRLSLRNFSEWAGLSDQITLHSLRRYSINKLAKRSLLGAQAIAGHKDSNTTLLYTKLDPEFIRDVHEQTGVVRGLLQNKREAARRKRLV